MILTFRSPTAISCVRVIMSKTGITRRSAAAALVALAGRPPAVRATEKPVEFGVTGDGTRVFLYTLSSKNRVQAQITNYGGILVSLKTPDRTGATADVVLGF